MTRTRIGHVLIVAGPSGAGKSTFLRQLAAGELPPELRAELPEGSQHWPQFSVRKEPLDALSGKQFDGLVLHCDLTKWGEANRVGLKRRVDEFISTAAGSVTVVDIRVTMDHLISHTAKRAFGTGSPNIAKLKGLTLTTARCARSVIRYAVSRIPNGLFIKFKRTNLQLAKSESKRVKSFEKLKFYQKYGEGWLDEVHQQWREMLQGFASPGIHIKFICIEPDLQAKSGIAEWRRKN